MKIIIQDAQDFQYLLDPVGSFDFDLIFVNTVKKQLRDTLVTILTMASLLSIMPLPACNARESATSLPTALQESRSDTLTGTVIKISDGDTFHMLLADKSTVKIRLHGIDCPEKQQPFYQQAKNALSTLIFQKRIWIEWKKKDRYGRLLAIAYLNNESVNERLLRDGLAWHFKRYDTRSEWDAFEKKARQEKIGIWSDPNPIAPWLFRQIERKN